MRYNCIMRIKKTFRIPFGNILCLSVNAVLTIIVLWVIIPVFLENTTIDSKVARFGMAFACVANLFSKHLPIRILLFIIAFILITISTVIYIHKANNI